MWACLASWLVQDGEVPELRLDAQLRQAALRASCWSIAGSERAEGVRALNTHTAEDGLPERYTVTGIVEKADEPNSVLLRVGSTHLFAEPNTFRNVGEDGALEAYSPTHATTASTDPAATCRALRCLDTTSMNRPMRRGATYDCAASAPSREMRTPERRNGAFGS